MSGVGHEKTRAATAVNELLSLAVIAASAYGCVAGAVLTARAMAPSRPIKMLVHLDTGSVVECTASGQASSAQSYVDDCARQYEALGYIPAEKLTDEQKKNFKPTTIHRSEPQVLPVAPMAPIAPTAPASPKRSFFCTQTGPRQMFCD